MAKKKSVKKSPVAKKPRIRKKKEQDVPQVIVKLSFLDRVKSFLFSH